MPKVLTQKEVDDLLEALAGGPVVSFSEEKVMNINIVRKGIYPIPQEVKKCPFCGYTGVLLRRDDSGFYVYCEGCSTYGPRKNNAQAAIDQWDHWHCEAQVVVFNEMGFSHDQICEYLTRLRQDETHKEIAKEVMQKALKHESKKEESKTNPSHYSRWKIEPLDFAIANNLDFLRGNIIKYIMRYDAKGGLDDLKKARVYLDKLIENWVQENEK